MVCDLFRGESPCLEHILKTFHRRTQWLMPPFLFVRTLVQFHSENARQMLLVAM